MRIILPRGSTALIGTCVPTVARHQMRHSHLQQRVLKAHMSSDTCDCSSQELRAVPPFASGSSKASGSLFSSELPLACHIHQSPSCTLLSLILGLLPHHIPYHPISVGCLNPHCDEHPLPQHPGNPVSLAYMKTLRTLTDQNPETITLYPTSTQGELRKGVIS